MIINVIIIASISSTNNHSIVIVYRRASPLVAMRLCVLPATNCRARLAAPFCYTIDSNNDSSNSSSSSSSNKW